MNLLQKDNILSLVPYLVFEIHANQMVSSLFNLCLAPKITKDMGKVDWNDHTCQQIARLWRTFSTTVSVHVHLALSNILVRDPYIFTYVYCVCVYVCVCARARFYCVCVRAYFRDHLRLVAQPLCRLALASSFAFPRLCTVFSSRYDSLSLVITHIDLLEHCRLVCTRAGKASK